MIITTLSSGWSTRKRKNCDHFSVCNLHRYRVHLFTNGYIRISVDVCEITYRVDCWLCDEKKFRALTNVIPNSKKKVSSTAQRSQQKSERNKIYYNMRFPESSESRSCLCAYITITYTALKFLSSFHSSGCFHSPSVSQSVGWLAGWDGGASYNYIYIQYNM